MDAFVQGMAALSGVRDRDALDAAFVRLVQSTTEEYVACVRLLRIVGEGEDRRLLMCAGVTRGVADLERDPIWRDWSQLPKLSDAPTYAQVVAGDGESTGSLDGAEQAFLVMAETTPWGVLVLRVDCPLPQAVVRLVQALVLTYQNVLGLLDYGEKDALTELLNRKTFDGAFFKATADHTGQRIDGAERRSEDAEGGYWLAVLDIDHFKRVNDTYGHLIGDEVLLLVARIMRNSFRFHDQLYRFGGEEFVILMRCREPQDAAHALERLRNNVQTYAFPQVGTITVSIGFSALHPHDTPGAAFGRADKAVYHAKSHGRNQVVNYEDLVQSGEVQETSDDMDVDLF